MTLKRKAGFYNTAKRNRGAAAVRRYVAATRTPDERLVRVSGSYGRSLRGSAEQKNFDTALSFAMDATFEVPATGQLCLVPQGTGDEQRIGRRITIKSIQIRGQAFFAPAAAATAATGCWLYLVMDKQTNGAAAAITDVFTSSVVNTALLNLDNNQRFVILKKWQWVMQPGAGATAAYNNSCKNIEWYKKCNIPIEYSSTTGAITEIRSNNIFLCAGSNPADDLVTFTGTARLRYTDN